MCLPIHMYMHPIMYNFSVWLARISPPLGRQFLEDTTVFIAQITEPSEKPPGAP